MHTELLIIRHAKSIANTTGMFGGITDYDLSQEGLEQAEALVKRLEDVDIDKIYSSPLKRAINTIKPTSEMKNLNINILDDLIEINVGTWEDKSVEDLRKMYPEECRYIDETDYYTGMEGQEETIDVSNRMYNAILEISKDNIGKTVVITSHIVAIRAFLCKVMNIPFEDTKNKIGNLENSSITKIIYNNDENKFNVEYIGKV